MPRRKRPGEWAVLYVEVPPELKAKMQAIADRHRRSLTAELIVALEAYTAEEPAPEVAGRKAKK